MPEHESEPTRPAGSKDPHRPQNDGPRNARVGRPRGRLRHYAGLLSAANLAAGRALAADHPSDRIRALLRRHRTSRRQAGLTVAPGGRADWRPVPAPPARPGPLGALVHPVAVALCDLDRPLMLGATPFPLPLHLGHECVAEVVAVGADVASITVGQRVVVPFQISCGVCPPCRAGRQGSCTGVPRVSMYGFGVTGGPYGGVLADQVEVPFADAMLVALPGGVDPVSAASVADNVADGYRHVAPHLPALLAQGNDAGVLILAGQRRSELFTASVPLYAGQVALALGATDVTVVDARPEVRATAERLGMRGRRPDHLPDVGEAPLVIDATGRAAGLRAALRHATPDGVVSSSGGLHASTRIPWLTSYIRNVTLVVGRTHARAAMPFILDLMAAGRLQPEEVTTLVAPFGDAVAALDEHNRHGSIKTVLTAD